MIVRVHRVVSGVVVVDFQLKGKVLPAVQYLRPPQRSFGRAGHDHPRLHPAEDLPPVEYPLELDGLGDLWMGIAIWFYCLLAFMLWLCCDMTFGRWLVLCRSTDNVDCIVDLVGVGPSSLGLGPSRSRSFSDRSAAASGKPDACKEQRSWVPFVILVPIPTFMEVL